MEEAEGGGLELVAAQVAQNGEGKNKRRQKDGAVVVDEFVEFGAEGEQGDSPIKWRYYNEERLIYDLIVSEHWKL